MAAATKKSSLPVTVLLTALVAIPLFIAPSVIRGFAAHAWVVHYTGMEMLPKPRRASARALIEKTDVAIRNLAPLPQASDAAVRVLELGQRVEAQVGDRDAALVLYQGVLAACNRVRERGFAGPGFAVIEARATALEAAANRAGAK